MIDRLMPPATAAVADPPRRRELWTVTAIFTLLTGVLAYPLPVRAGEVLLGDYPDSHLFVWTLGWLAHALADRPLAIFEANIFYPLHDTLAFSENLIGSGLIAAPIIWLTGNHLLAVNVVSLLSVPLCGVGAYVLARRLGLTAGGAFICGVIFAFSPARFFRIGQLHLTTVQWIPFTLAYLHSYLDRGRPADLKRAAGFFSLQALTSGHGAVFLTVAMAVIITHKVTTTLKVAPLRWIKDLGVTGLLLLAPAVAVAVPYQLVQDQMGRGRALEDWTVAGVSYIASPSRVHQSIIGLFVPIARVTDVAHAFLFPGYLPILLAIVAIVVSRRQEVAIRTSTVTYALLLVAGLLLIAGPPLGIWPLVYWLPGFNFIRVPSRFVILTVLALAVLGAIGFERIHNRLPQQRQAVFTVAVAALLLIEFATVPLAVTPFSLRPPAAERWLADQPVPFVVAEVPNSGAPREQTAYMLHSMAHWQKTIHGYSGYEPPGHTALYAAMKGFPDPRSLSELRAFRVTYVVVHKDRYASERWPAVERRLAVESRLELLFQDQRSQVYRLRYDPGTSNPSQRTP